MTDDVWRLRPGENGGVLEGATGPQGLQGPVGPQGPQGLKGDVGLTGPVGPQGLTGATGTPGAAGPQGIQGVKGDTGLQGVQGLTGAKGDTGNTGAQGIQGIKGDTGTQGIQGVKGDTGAQGVKGDTGATGPQGAGVQIKGSRTDPSALPTTGNSLGDTYIMTTSGSGYTAGDGYTYTGSGFTNVGQIRGPQGVPGATGAQGPKGDTGAQGIQGVKGDTGTAGAQGPKGDTGTTGAAGAAGAQGVKGDTGNTGAQGIQGVAGTNGADGAAGAQGAKGDTGAAGAKGDTGAQGIQGIQGVKGDTGNTGAQGIQGNTGAAGTSPVTGQCKLVVTNNTTVTLKPYKGNKIWINGALETIPSAGITLSNSGLTASTPYYVYAYKNAGNLVLEASTTARATDATYGHEIKTGDGTRTLVGVVIPNSSGYFVDTVNWRSVSNWFDREIIGDTDQTQRSGATSSGSATELSTAARCYIWVWAGDTLGGHAEGYGYTNSGISGNYYGFCAIDDQGTKGGVNNVATNFGSGVATAIASSVKKKQSADGFRYISAAGYVNSAGSFNMTGNFNVSVSARG